MTMGLRLTAMTGDAGITGFNIHWIPACAGMTEKGQAARRQAGETELRRGRCGGSDVAGTPTQRPRKLSKRGRARYGTHRTGLILAVLRRRGGLWDGDRL